jgi:2-dehydropantoate 2-reductase
VALDYGATLRCSESQLTTLEQSMGNFKMSMLQDFDSGRPFELQALGEAVLELAEGRTSPPVTSAALAMTNYF